MMRADTLVISLHHEDIHMKIKAAHSCDSGLLVTMNINLKKQRSDLCSLGLDQRSANPILESLIPARFSILQVDRAFTWLPLPLVKAFSAL